MDNHEDQKSIEVSFKPVLYTSWRHPDIKLERIIHKCSVLGYPKTRIAEIAGVDVRTLEYYYNDVLVHGKALLATQLLEVAAKEAMSGNEKMLKYLLDKVSPFGDTRSKGAQQEGDKPEEIKEEDLNLKNLTVKELKELRRLMNKAKKPIDGKVE